MTFAVVAWWALLAGGIIPATWFLIRFRPSWPIRPKSLIILAFVAAGWFGYARSLVSVALRDWTPTFHGTADIVTRLTFTALMDVVLIAALALFLKYRRDWLDDYEHAKEAKADE